MKFSVLQENLSTALDHVSRFVSSKTQLPILSNILLSTDDGRLKLSATNLNLAINYWLGAKIDTKGTISIPSREITEFISYLPTGKIDLELTDKSLLKVISSKAESEFATTPATDFPQIPSIDPKTAFDIDLSLLTDAISQVAFSAAIDDTRPVLTAILCQFTPANLTLVATDGFRLSTKSIKLVNPIKLADGQESLNLLIPARSLVEVTKLAKNAKKVKIGLTPDGNQVVFVLDDLEIVSRLSEGQYPDYQRIIPDSSSTKVQIGRDDFAQSIKMASVFAHESANVVRFTVNSESLQLSANAPQVGRNQAQIDAKVDGPPLEVAFNYKFVSDFLNACKSQEMILELNESLSPGVFRDQSDPSYLHIIMPVRLQD